MQLHCNLLSFAMHAHGIMKPQRLASVDGGGPPDVEKRGAALPRRVDREARRRVIAEAIFEVIGNRGLEAVSLLRDRGLARLQLELAQLANPGARQRLRAAARVMLPVGQQGRQEAIVAGAFYSIATVQPAQAELLRDGYGRLLAVSRQTLHAAEQDGQLADGIDPDTEGAMLFFMIQGLVGPILIGLLSPEDALALIDHQLDRIFR